MVTSGVNSMRVNLSSPARLESEEAGALCDRVSAKSRSGKQNLVGADKTRQQAPKGIVITTCIRGLRTKAVSLDPKRAACNAKERQRTRPLNAHSLDRSTGFGSFLSLFSIELIRK